MELTVDYSDPDANVRGGRIDVTGTFTTTPITVTFRVPEDTVSTTGTTSGSITLAACVTFGGTAQITFKFVLFDALNNRSNALTTTVGRPAASP